MAASTPGPHSRDFPKPRRRRFVPTIPMDPALLADLATALDSNSSAVPDAKRVRRWAIEQSKSLYPLRDKRRNYSHDHERKVLALWRSQVRVDGKKKKRMNLKIKKSSCDEVRTFEAGALALLPAPRCASVFWGRFEDLWNGSTVNGGQGRALWKQRFGNTLLILFHISTRAGSARCPEMSRDVT